jgi:hypothetical protein
MFAPEMQDRHCCSLSMHYGPSIDICEKITSTGHPVSLQPDEISPFGRIYQNPPCCQPQGMVAPAAHVLGANFSTILVSQAHIPDAPLVVSCVRDQRIFWFVTWLLPVIVQIMDEVPVAETATAIAPQRDVVAPCMPTAFSSTLVAPLSAVASAAVRPCPTLFSILIFAGVMSAKAAPTWAREM